MSTATIIERARSQGRVILSEVEAKQILAEAGIPVVETRLARNPEEAVAIANELGYPVALKILSPQITHKSDVGGVRLNVQDARGVVSAFEEIVNNARRAAPDATIEGVSVQRMAKPGVEVIIGMTKDPQFGPVLMFGLGGILVEVLKDVAFRIVPLAPRDAKQMIREIKGYPLLEGYRGQPPSDVAALETMLLKLSEFVDAHPELAELDLNPVFAYPEGAVAVDARIVLEKEA
ncbi:MAG TPA: acetate--CoA ligase family protein [Dehalococcoidia bacterium]|nr:acetate--CoA ligase family protein [Dehalococcoidia bacterium]